MQALLSVADYVIIGIMLSISAVTGLYFRFTGGRQKTTQEFLMAGRDMSILPVACSIMASTYSGISMLGAPADIYLYGADIITSDVTFALGGFLAVYLFLPVFFDMNVSTTYEYLEKRFGKSTRYATSFLFCIQMTLYMPVVVYAPSLALSTVTGISVWTSVLSMSTVCTFYSAMGGLKAVLWTDLFQSMLMIATLLSLVIQGSLNFGGLGKVFETAIEGGRLDILKTTTDFTVRYTLWNCMVQGIVYGAYLNGTCHTQVQRLMSVRNVKRAQRAYLWSMPVTFAFRSFCVLTGVVIYANFHNCSPLKDPNIDLHSSDQIAPYFLLKIFSGYPGMPGFCIAGIFSGALSTMSSAINSLVAVTLQDFIKPLMKKRSLKDSTANMLAKTLAIMYGVLSVLLTFAISNSKKVIEVATMVLGMVGGPTLGVYCLGMFTSSTNEWGSLIGLFMGFSINAWMSFGTMYYRPEYPFLPLSIEGCESSVNKTESVGLSERNSSLLHSEMVNTTYNFNVDNKEERYIFPMYKVSYMWFTMISFMTTIIIGYISSLLIGLGKSRFQVDPQNLSPIKRWIAGYPKTKDQYAKVTVDSHQIELEGTYGLASEIL